MSNFRHITKALINWTIVNQAILGFFILIKLNTKA